MTMAPLVDALTHVFAPWNELFSNSKAVAAGVTAVHLVALLFGGGFAVAADRMMLRTRFGGAAARYRLTELEAVHRPVLIAIGVLFASGLALATADVETFSKSPYFAAKLSLVALLLINGLVLTRTERALHRIVHADRDAAGTWDRDAPRLWQRLRLTSWLSLALWGSTAIAGTVLANMA